MKQNSIIKKIKFSLWNMGIITMHAKELGLPTEKEFLKGLGDSSQISTKKIDASLITTTPYFPKNK